LEAADILLLRGAAGSRPVTFFDVAGEDLQNIDAKANRFLVGATALVFVVGLEDRLDVGQAATLSENRSFELAMERVRDRDIPAVIVASKADRLRYVPPADRWLRRGDEHTLDADRVRGESRDVYAYLHQAGMSASLRPYAAFTRCTLHFVSASGGEAVPVVAGDRSKMYYPRGFHPTRVLEPLVSILAMTGVIPGPEAEKVGLP
jgi:hypothetical protein